MPYKSSSNFSDIDFAPSSPLVSRANGKDAATTMSKSFGSNIANRKTMTRQKFHGFDPGLLREELKKVRIAKDVYADAEKNLVRLLHYADINRLYVWLGYKSLTGYCTQGLKLGKTQTQRLVTQVRRFEPTANLGQQLTKYDERATRLDPFFEEMSAAGSNKFEVSPISGKKKF